MPDVVQPHSKPPADNVWCQLAACGWCPKFKLKCSVWVLVHERRRLIGARDNQWNLQGTRLREKRYGRTKQQCDA